MADAMDQSEDMPRGSLTDALAAALAGRQQQQQQRAGGVRLTASASFSVLGCADSGCFPEAAAASAPASPAPAEPAFSPAVPSRTRAPPACSPRSKPMHARLRGKGGHHRRAVSDTSSLLGVNFAAQIVKTDSYAELSTLDDERQRVFRSLHPTVEEHAEDTAGPSGSGRHSPPRFSAPGEVDINEEVDELLSFGKQLAPMRKSAASHGGISVDDLANMDPKRARRIIANRQSAARSKERKMRYIYELEDKVVKLQGEMNGLRREYRQVHQATESLADENRDLEQKLLALEESQNLREAAFRAMPSAEQQQQQQLPTLEEPGALHPSLPHAPQPQLQLQLQQLQQQQLQRPQPQPQQQQQQQPQQQQQQPDAMWSNRMTAMPLVPAPAMGGDIMIQLPDGSQIQVPQGSVVRTGDGTLLISGASQGMSPMTSPQQGSRIVTSAPPGHGPGMVASASNSSLTDVTARTINRPPPSVAIQGAHLSPEGQPLVYQPEGRLWACGQAEGAPAGAASGSQPPLMAAAPVGAPGGGKQESPILRLSSLDALHPLEGLDSIDESWFRSLQDKATPDDSLHMME